MSPSEAAALTRLVLSYCLGRGSITAQSRSWVLKINQSSHREAVAAHEWEQLREFLPTIKPYKWVPGYSDRAAPGAGNWQVRVSSRYFETAHNLLYSNGFYVIRSSILELLGAEAIAALWADRGELLEAINRKGVLGKLTLNRYDFKGAECVRDWLYTLTGAKTWMSHVSYAPTTPVLEFDRQSMTQLMESIAHTWYAKTPVLRRQFDVPIELRSEVAERIRQQRTQTAPEVLEVPALTFKSDNREAMRTDPTAIEPLDVPSLLPPDQTPNALPT